MKIKFLLLAALWLLILVLLSLPAAHGQNTVVSYQGRATTGGTNFTGAGQFKFALVTSTNTAATATATATVNSGFVTAYTVTFGGSGYVTPPIVTISGGGGAGATATAEISGGVVTNILAVTAGSGYTSTPTVTLSAAPDTIEYMSWWSHDGTSIAGSQPTSAVTVPVADGWFTASLGDTTATNMGTLSAALFQQTNLQLRVWFSDGVNGFSVFHPAPRLTIAPYAGHAFSAGTINAPSNQPVNLTVNGLTVLRLTTGTSVYGTTVNSVGGHPDNIISNGVHGGFIGGGGWPGARNIVGGYFGTVVGGANNKALGFLSTAMGYSSTASGDYSTAIGNNNSAIGYAATAIGYSAYATGYQSTAIGSQPAARGDYSTAFGYNTEAVGIYSLAMGVSSAASNLASTAMGYGTVARGDYATAMGQNSDASGDRATAMSDSTASGSYALSAGYHSVASADFSVAMGYEAIASGVASLSVGDNTVADGLGAMALGYGAAANADYTVALGSRSSADHTGSFVWGDSSAGVVDSAANNSVTMRAAGGYRLFSNAGLTAGVSLAAGGTAWGVISDRNVKKDFTPVNSEEVLEKLAALPITRWHYRWEDTNSPPHLGPMAQDFKAAFYPGTDDKVITTQEADGVALAAIQGLHQKLERKEAEVRELRDAVRELQELVKALAGKQTQGAK